MEADATKIVMHILQAQLRQSYLLGASCRAVYALFSARAGLLRQNRGAIRTLYRAQGLARKYLRAHSA